MSGDSDAAPLLVERDGHLLVLTMNRPAVRNAVNRAMAGAIATAIDELDADPELRVGILTGAGGSFCAGLDLKAILDGEERAVEGRGFGGLTEAPSRKPLIAAVEGYALAGGFEMVLACDLIVAAEGSEMGLPEVKRGLIAGSGGLLRLPGRLPFHLAMEYALTGERLSAAEAYRWGLVNRLVEPGTALEAAKQLAVAIAANAPAAVGVSKQIVAEAGAAVAAEDWARQHRLVEEIVASDDAREGSAAFLEKREPRWTGH
jgi:enoyl-CoA hydratase